VLLFHDYAPGGAAAAHALTRAEMLRDLLVTLAIVATGNAFGAGRAGRAEAMIGCVDFDDPVVQRSPTSYRRPAFVYAAAGVYLIVVVLLRPFVPAAPSLVVVALLRAGYCGVLAYIVAGLAYVRGVADTLGGAS